MSSEVGRVSGASLMMNAGKTAQMEGTPVIHPLNLHHQICPKCDQHPISDVSYVRMDVVYVHLLCALGHAWIVEWTEAE